MYLNVALQSRAKALTINGKLWYYRRFSGFGSDYGRVGN